MLADLQRRAPGRPLVQTLVTIADQADHDLAALREAADVALNVVGDAVLANPSSSAPSSTLPRVSVRKCERKPMRPRDGTLYSMRLRPAPMFCILVI